MHAKRLILGAALLLISTPAPAQQETFLLVSSRNGNSVRMYDAQTGAYMRDWAAPGIGGLDRTQEVIYGPDGHVYVSGIGTPVVLKFDGQTGEFLGPFTSGYELDSPTKVSWGPDGLMYVSQWGQERGQRDVARFNPMTGEFIDEFTSDNPFGACDHEWDADGNMYLASFGSKTVFKYTPDGSRVGTFTGFVPAHGPVDLYWAMNGDLMVVDWDHGRINAHDPKTGEFKRTFIQGMRNTEGVTTGPDGRIYAADWTQNTINIYSASTGEAEGGFIGEDGGLASPNALIFGPQEATTSTSEEIPAAFGFRAETNFPNPFSTSTRIPFFAENGGSVLLRVFDLQGRLVKSISTTAIPGTSELELNGSTLTSGPYAYTLEMNGQVRKGLLIRR